LLLSLDCFAEPVIGAHSRDPSARNDGRAYDFSTARIATF